MSYYCSQLASFYIIIHSQHIHSLDLPGGQEQQEIHFPTPVFQMRAVSFHGCTRDPETNSQFAPENGWLDDDPFLLGDGPISG